jgi:small conductance mechanosensitive channel
MANFLGQTLPYTEITVFQLLVALVILIVGWVIAKIIVLLFRKGLTKTELPELVAELLVRFLSVLLYVIVILLAVAALGFSVNAVVIGLSAVIGLILAFGLQDSFTNLAAGVWIAALRPLDKDEVVDVNGIVGKVTAVGLMATELLAYDNKFITIPNKLVWGSPIINYTRMPTRRVDVDVGISYDSDLTKAYHVAMNLLKEHSLVLTDPEPMVVTTELADSSVNLQLRAWTKTEDYWNVKLDLTNGIFEAYRTEGIQIPFPQLDVHLEQK